MNVPFRAQVEALPGGFYIFQAIDALAGAVGLSPTLVGSSRIHSGTGSPENRVSGRIGDLFLRTDGSAGTTLYVKESGTGSTGWSGV